MYFDIFSNANLLLRWIHVVFGILWLGGLFLFGLVILQDGGHRCGGIGKGLFRLMSMGALTALISGFLLFLLTYAYEPGLGFGLSSNLSDVDGLTPRALWILMGMDFGILMFLLFWFGVKPTRRKIHQNPEGETVPALRARIRKLTRINILLAGPLLIGMLAAPHYGAGSWGRVLVAAGFGLLLMWGVTVILRERSDRRI